MLNILQIKLDDFNLQQKINKHIIDVKNVKIKGIKTPVIKVKLDFNLTEDEILQLIKTDRILNSNKRDTFFIRLFDQRIDQIINRINNLQELKALINDRIYFINSINGVEILNYSILNFDEIYNGKIMTKDYSNGKNNLLIDVTDVNSRYDFEITDMFTGLFAETFIHFDLDNGLYSTIYNCKGDVNNEK